MRSLITGVRVANKIKMLRSMYRNITFILVEGDTDRRCLGKFVFKSSCDVQVADGKDNVIEAINILNQNNFNGVLGIIDCDFNELDKSKLSILNLFYTDVHDLESMIIKSPALDNILAEYADKVKLEEFLAKQSFQIRDLLLANALYVGYCRWFSMKGNCNLDFDELDFELFVCKTNLSLDLNKFLQSILANSKKTTINDIDQLAKSIEKLANIKYDLWHVCCGHDLVEILLISLKHIFGSYNTSSLTVGALQGDLRLTYEYTYFTDTELFKSLQDWENKNPVYSIFTNSVSVAS